MSIQFRCTACNQPIEVDDEHAGKAAACPYCQNVVTVPTESTYQPEVVPAARPTGDAGALPAEVPDRTSPPPPPGGLHVGQTLLPRERMARMFGNFALLCTILMALLFAAVTVQVLTGILDKLGSASTTQPITPEQVSAIQGEVMNRLSRAPWFLITAWGTVFFGVVGLALAVTSVLQSRRGNWRGILSLVLCGLYVLCTCGGGLITLIFGGALVPA